MGDLGADLGFGGFRGRPRVWGISGQTKGMGDVGTDLGYGGFRGRPRVWGI